MPDSAADSSKHALLSHWHVGFRRWHAISWPRCGISVATVRRQRLNRRSTGSDRRDGHRVFCIGHHALPLPPRVSTTLCSPDGWHRSREVSGSSSAGGGGALVAGEHEDPAGNAAQPRIRVPGRAAAHAAPQHGAHVGRRAGRGGVSCSGCVCSFGGRLRLRLKRACQCDGRPLVEHEHAARPQAAAAALGGGGARRLLCVTAAPLHLQQRARLGCLHVPLHAATELEDALEAGTLQRQHKQQQQQQQRRRRGGRA